MPSFETDNQSEVWLKTLPSLAGRRVLITGATDGIGKVAAVEMARKGASLLVLARCHVKAEALMLRCQQMNPEGDYRYVHCDLADFSSCEAAIQEVLRMTQQVDVMIANAGVAFDHDSVNTHNVNKTFFVNHTAHFAIITALLPLLDQSTSPRIVMQSSIAHYTATGNFDSYFQPQTQSMSSAYADSKLANILFARHLTRLSKKQGNPYFACAVHPGYLVTNINRETVSTNMGGALRSLMSGNYKTLLLYLGNRLGLVQPSGLSAALPLLHAAFGPSPALYTGPNSFLGLRGVPDRARASRMARSTWLSEQLWGQSLSYCLSRAANPSLWHAFTHRRFT